MKMLSKKFWLSWIKMRSYVYSIFIHYALPFFNPFLFLHMIVSLFSLSFLQNLRMVYSVNDAFTLQGFFCHHAWQVDCHPVATNDTPTEYYTLPLRTSLWTGTSQSHPFLPISLASNSQPKYQPHAKPTLVSNKYQFMMFYLAFSHHKIICNFVIFFISVHLN